FVAPSSRTRQRAWSSSCTCCARRSCIPPLIEPPSGGVMLLAAAPARNESSECPARLSPSGRPARIPTLAASSRPTSVTRQFTGWHLRGCAASSPEQAGQPSAELQALPPLIEQGVFRIGGGPHPEPLARLVRLTFR